MMTASAGRPRLNVTQMAWLSELGIDRKLLATIADTSAVFVTGGAAATKPPPALENETLDVRRTSVAPRADRAVPKIPVAPPAVRRGDSPAGLSSVSPIDLKALPSDLCALATCVAQCQGCDLHAGRHQTVFGDGALDSPDWVIVGEAPGDHDDHLGLPFQGKAGELLESMLLAAGILPDARVFYTNLLKCRPQGGRSPKPAEIEACLPYLRRQISLIRPRGILVLGWHAAQALTNQRVSLDQLRGQVCRYIDADLDIPLVATHHPASLMLRGHYKAAAWRDLHLAQAALRA